jgi:predicted XRE-type DNA-binding protein
MVNHNSTNQKVEIQASSGNVFADLGLENADELLLKAELARQISNIISQQQMTQTEVAKTLEIEEDTVSNLTKGKLSDFSTVQLFRFLNILGQDVEIVVKTKSQSSSLAQTRVIATKE